MLKENKLHRTVLNIYWLISLLTISFHLFNFFYNIYNFNILINELTKNLIFILMILILEYILKYTALKNKEYIFILSGVIISSLWIYTHSYIYTVPIVFIVPILLSGIYYNKKLTVISSLKSIVIILFMYHTMNVVHSRVNIIELILLVLIFSSACCLSIIIINRGLNTQNKISELIHIKKDILSKNIHLEHQSKLDPLTGMYNHGSFHQFLDQLISNDNHSIFSIQLAILDIDNFKYVNDNFGHDNGDIVLKRVAEIIQRSLNAESFSSRYGGEEFAIIFLNQNIEDTYTYLNEIREKISNMSNEELDYKQVTISIGLAEHQKGDTKQVLFDKADSFLYKAKKTGKNKIIF